MIDNPCPQTRGWRRLEGSDTTVCLDCGLTFDWFNIRRHTADEAEAQREERADVFGGVPDDYRTLWKMVAA